MPTIRINTLTAELELGDQPWYDPTGQTAHQIILKFGDSEIIRWPTGDIWFGEGSEDYQTEVVNRLVADKLKALFALLEERTP